MCVALPARVVAVGDGWAEVEHGSERRMVQLALLPEVVAIGDWLVLRAQSFAVAKISEEEAQQSLALFAELSACLEGAGLPH